MDVVMLFYLFEIFGYDELCLNFYKNTDKFHPIRKHSPVVSYQHRKFAYQYTSQPWRVLRSQH